MRAQQREEEAAQAARQSGLYVVGGGEKRQQRGVAARGSSRFSNVGPVWMATRREQVAQQQLPR